MSISYSKRIGGCVIGSVEGFFQGYSKMGIIMCIAYSILKAMNHPNISSKPLICMALAAGFIYGTAGGLVGLSLGIDRLRDSNFGSFIYLKEVFLPSLYT